MRSPRPLLCFALLAALALGTAGSASAATGLTARREQVEKARGRVDALKRDERQLRGELDAVGARIEGLKATRKGKGARSPELDASLRRSQELSGALSELAKSLSQAESAAELESAGLVEALSSEIGQLRAALERAPEREARRRLLTQLKALREERERVRTALPAASLSTLEASRASAGRSSEEPEELLEQADALRDDEDKVRRELKSLEGLIAERREERELDRRMNEFLGDESLFDEQDRQLRTTRSPRAAIPALGASSGAPASAEASAADSAGPQSGGAQPTSTGTSSSNTDTAGQNSGSGGSRTFKSTSDTTTSSTQPKLLNQSAPAPGAASGRDDLDSLEKQRARLEQLARELDARAKALEQRAQQLR